MLTANALAAAKAAYDIEIACLTEMKDYFDDEAFAHAVELLAAAPRIGSSGWPPRRASDRADKAIRASSASISPI